MAPTNNGGPSYGFIIIIFIVTAAVLISLGLRDTGPSKFKRKITPIISDPLSSVTDFACRNGGIGFNGACICPLGWSGYQCDYVDGLCGGEYEFDFVYPGMSPDPDPLHVSPATCVLPPDTLCCWRKQLLDEKATASTTVRSLAALHESDIKNRKFDNYNNWNRLFHIYGPWSESDKQMLSYLVGTPRTPGPLRAAKMVHPPPALPQVSSSPELHFEPDHTKAKRTRLAFVIMVHMDPGRLGGLLESIYSPDHLYVVHLDANLNHWQTQEARTTVEKYKQGNVRLMGRRFAGTWGDISLVYMNIACIVELLQMDKNSASPWSHVINLSIYDAPLKPIYRLEEFLAMEEHKDRNFINVEDLGRNDRRQNLHITCNRVNTRILFPNGMQACGGDTYAEDFQERISSASNITLVNNWMYLIPVGHEHTPTVYHEGSQWHILSRAFAEWFVSSIESVEMLFSFKFTFIPDESMFQTAILNSPFKHTHINNHYRWINWKRGNINVLAEDKDELKRTNHFFARKVIDPKVFEMIMTEVVPAWK
eukprot:TRINITY_DN8141_c0_g1_i1.p1 TRINITY_DN8141_c0_g1~~TRINITY_DN8141_c0_g1_i1.p1  ORF type:complete len:537 (-),score=113.10 TRINITY_DN8141_c0_g1_i1:35-1645(-)